MADLKKMPAANPATQVGTQTAPGFDLHRFGTEVANEIGVDPGDLSQYGLTPERVRQYETQTHSR